MPEGPPEPPDPGQLEAMREIERTAREMDVPRAVVVEDLTTEQFRERYLQAATAMEQELLRAEVDIRRVIGADFAMPAANLPMPPTQQDRDSALIKAEKLLREALPEELYVSLCALEYFIIKGKDNSYKISKDMKTRITMLNGSVHEACIEFAYAKLPQPPPADRVVMEYLLIKSDEQRYLETANLTRISGPRGEVPDGYAVELRRQREYLQAARMDMVRLVPNPPRVGGTINIRRPPQYITMSPRQVGRTQTHILHAMSIQIVRLLADDERLRGIRFPLRSIGHWSVMGTILRPFMIGTQREATDLVEGQNTRFLERVCAELVRDLNNHIQTHIINIEGIAELPPVEYDHHFQVLGSIAQRDMDRGLCVRLTHLSDHDTQRSMYRAEMRLMLRP